MQNISLKDAIFTNESSTIITGNYRSLLLHLLLLKYMSVMAEDDKIPLLWLWRWWRSSEHLENFVKEEANPNLSGGDVAVWEGFISGKGYRPPPRQIVNPDIIIEHKHLGENMTFSITSYSTASQLRLVTHTHWDRNWFGVVLKPWTSNQLIQLLVN